LLAADLNRVLGKKAARDLPADVQVNPADVEGFA